MKKKRVRVISRKKDSDFLTNINKILLVVVLGLVVVIMSMLVFSLNNNYNNDNNPGEFPSNSPEDFPFTCTDSDGLDISRKGFISGTYNGADFFYDDVCYPFSERKILEYYCNFDTNKPARDVYLCPGKCIDGACPKIGNEAID